VLIFHVNIDEITVQVILSDVSTVKNEYLFRAEQQFENALEVAEG